MNMFVVPYSVKSVSVECFGLYCRQSKLSCSMSWMVDMSVINSVRNIFIA
jgi:hypothetical protein